MNIIRLNKMVEEGLLRVQKHPNASLYIYNYTQKVQFERLWNEVTLACRGLILDSEGHVISRPFRKFFNIEEYELMDIPKLPFTVQEKMDGSLGVSYQIDNQWFIATRGSFDSDQAIKANGLLQSEYDSACAKMNPDFTYIFEIIYPENRIVVDYGLEEKLVLLGVKETKTGIDQPLENIGFPLVKTYHGINDIHQLKSLEEDNREGFVVRFDNGLRLKVKFTEYLRLHKIVTELSSYAIWNFLRSGESLEEILEHVPDEFFQWASRTKVDLEAAYKKMEKEAQDEYKELSIRKDTAEYFKTCAHTSILFLMLDKKEYGQAIWKKIKPDYDRPFKN